MSSPAPWKGKCDVNWKGVDSLPSTKRPAVIVTGKPRILISFKFTIAIQSESDPCSTVN